MKKCIWLLAVVSILFLCSCSGVEKKDINYSVEDTPTKVQVLPATFIGETPCPDCLRVDIVLNLRSDGIYLLKKTYQSEAGAIKSEAQLSRWRYAEEGGFIIVGRRKGELKTYAIVDQDRLRFVGKESINPDEQIQYDLMKTEEPYPFTDTLKLRGMFRYDGEQASIAECQSGNLFSVTGENEFDRLVQAYLNTPHGFGDPLLVSLHGKLMSVMKADNVAKEEIVVEHFKRFYSNIDCEGKQTGASLTGTVWRLVEVDGKQVILTEKEQRPYFTLNPKNGELKGSGGCNLLSGSYLVKGEIFLIKRLVTTRMACPMGVEIETSFLRALDSTETFHVRGDVLQLLDEEGKVKAVMQADV